MSKRRLILLSLIVLGAAAIIVVAVRQVSHPSTTVTPQQLTYTDAITGQTVTDLTGEAPGQQLDGVVPPPSIALNGVDQLTNLNLLTDEQYGNAILVMKKFLLARSGLDGVSTGVENDNVTQTADGSVQFTLVVERPYSKYLVTIHVVNQSQTIPDITFKQVE